MEDKKLHKEELEAETLDNIAGGSKGPHIDHIICHGCGYELPVHGMHNFLATCPRCGGPMKTW